MFTKELRQIYYNLPYRLQERVKSQMLDRGFITDVVNKHYSEFNFDGKEIAEKCYDDFYNKIKKSGATKIRSAKAIDKFYNKYNFIKIGDNFCSYCVHPKKKESYLSLFIVKPIKTKRGILYLIRNQGKHVVLMHSHALRRYGERFNGTTNLTDCLKLLTKEFAHIKRDDREESHEALLRKGFASQPIDIVIASGLLLADNIMFNEGLSVDYIKTYIPLKMLNKTQDNLHEVLWNEILQKREEDKIKMPLI